MSVLPPKLERWKKLQQEQPEEATAREILAEYFSFFGKDKVKEELWLLTTSTLTNEEVHQANTAKGRHDLLFFYEFTVLVMEVMSYLSTKDAHKMAV